jgi:hypothetical protein
MSSFSSGRELASRMPPNHYRSNRIGSLRARRLALLILVTVGACGCSRAARVQPPVGRPIEGVISSHQGDKAIVAWGDSTRSASLLDFASRHEEAQGTGGAALHGVGSWAPDDASFAGVRGRGSGYLGIMDAKSLQWRELAIPAAFAAVGSSWPSWSPDGRWLILEILGTVAGTDGYYTCAYDVTSGKVRVVAPGNVYKSGLAYWNGRVVFSQHSVVPGSRGRLRYRFYCRSIQGGDGLPQSELLPNLFVRRMSVSPRGNAAAALCLPMKAVPEDDADSEGWEIYVVTSPDSPRGRRVASGRFEGTHLEWSPAGDRLLVYALRDPGDLRAPDLVLVDVPKGRAEPVRDARGRIVSGRSAQFARDGKQIIYVRRTPSGADGIFAHVIATGEETQLYPW